MKKEVRRSHLVTWLALCTLVFLPGLAAAQPLGTTWTSSDTSIVIVELGPEGVFYWKNPDGSEIYLYAGTRGGRFQLSDHKTKSGSVIVDPGVINLLLGSDSDTSEPKPATTEPQPADKAVQAPAPQPVLVDLHGEILSGVGTFDMTFTDFFGIGDATYTFNAALVSDGTDNPLDLTVGAQGDQIPLGGTLSYVTKWQSGDTITLSNGDTLVIGAFYLITVGDPTSFFYSLTHTTYFSDFTVAQRYQFVNDLSQPATGANLRFELDGRVTKIINGVIP